MAQPPKPPRPGHDLLEGLEAATADLDNLSLVGLDGEDPGVSPGPAVAASAPALTPEPGERALEAGVANLEIALEHGHGPAARPAAAPPPAAGPPGPLEHAGGGLDLDFDAAGLGAPLEGQSAPGPAPAVTPSPPSPPVPAQRGSVSPRRASGEKIGLFGEDRVLGFIVGGAIGLVVGIYPALQSGRRVAEEETRELITELEAAVDRPLAVRAGDLREPGQIQADIERAYGPARSRFWLVWLAIAVPVGVGLGLLRRKA